MATVRAEEAIPVLAELGYQSVELAVVTGWRDALGLLAADRRRRIKRLLQEYQLALPALASNVDLLADDPADFDENWRQLTGTVDLAVEWASGGGPPAVDTYVGGQPSDWAAKRELAAERVGRLCDYAAARGVAVALQPHMDGALDRPEKVPWLVRAVGRPNLGITLDINDFTVQGIPLEDAVGLLAPHAIHAHVKDEVGRQPDYRFVVPGEGEFDYPRYLRAMRAAGYRGDVCVEISLRVQRRPGFDPFAAAASAYHVLSSAFDAAGIARGR